MSKSPKHGSTVLFIACLSLVVIVILVYVVSCGGDKTVRIYPSSRPRTVRCGHIGTIYAGQELRTTYEVVNMTKEDLRISLRNSCTCTHSSIEPTRILAGHKAKLTLVFDSGAAPRDRTESRSVDLMLKAIPEAVEAQNIPREYCVALSGQVEVRNSLRITEVVSFDRQDRLRGKGLTKAIQIVGYAPEPIRVTWTPSRSSAFLLPSTREFLLPAGGKAELPVVLTEHWSGERKEQEQLTFTFCVGQSSWSETVQLAVYPVLRYRAEPPALLLGQLREDSDNLERDIRIVQRDGQPCREVRIVSFDPNTLSVSLRGDGRITAQIKMSHWGKVNRRSITVACGMEPNDTIMEIPVVAYVPTAQNSLATP